MGLKLLHELSSVKVDYSQKEDDVKIPEDGNLHGSKWGPYKLNWPSFRPEEDHKHFNLEGIQFVEIGLFTIQEDMTHESVIQTLAEKGYRPAIFQEAYSVIGHCVGTIVSGEARFSVLVLGCVWYSAEIADMSADPENRAFPYFDIFMTTGGERGGLLCFHKLSHPFLWKSCIIPAISL